VILHTGDSVTVPPEQPGVTVIDLDDPRDFDHLGTSVFRSNECEALTYTYAAVPVCVADFPHVRFTATGTGDVYIAQNTHSAGLAEAGGPPITLPWDEHQAIPFPTTDWEAIRTDTSEVFDTGSFTLAQDNPCATVPGAPSGLRVTGGNGTITATWTAPVNNGGSPITGYKVGISPDGVNFTTLSQGTATSRTFNLSQRGTRFYVRVQAVNAVGDSAFSTVQNAVTWNVPAAPRSLTAVATNVSGQVRLSWLLPASNGGAAITDYTIQRSPNGSSGWVTINDGVRTATSYTVTGLSNGTRYYFRVLAKNVVGNSAASNVTNAASRTTPAAPRSLAATPENGRVALRWVAPASNGGAPVTDYVIQRYVSGGSWVTVNDGVRATTAYTVTGLRNGVRYYFRVFARNAAGTGPVSNTVNAIPRTVTSAPRLRVYPGSGRALLTWTPPTSNGGAAITRYVIQRSTSPTTGWANLSTTTAATARSFNAAGLRNGTRYYFRIAAVNAAGTGAWSPVINAAPSALAGSSYYFANCTAVQQAGAAPLLRTQPGYRTGLDRDRDGVACE
jgi:titin